MWLFSLIILNQLQSLNDILGEAETTVRKSAYIIAFVWTHPNLGVPVVQSHEFSRYRGDCRLAVPTGFIRGISARKLDSFRLD